MSFFDHVRIVRENLKNDCVLICHDLLTLELQKSSKSKQKTHYIFPTFTDVCQWLRCYVTSLRLFYQTSCQLQRSSEFCNAHFCIFTIIISDGFQYSLADFFDRFNQEKLLNHPHNFSNFVH